MASSKVQNNNIDEEWEHLLFSPLYAIIPRVIWPSKPLANFGSWASVHIYGSGEENSIGITPQAYSYLVARFFGIIFFFFMFGLVQKVMFNLFYLNASYIPFYILMYFEIGYPSVVPWAYISGTIKLVITVLPVIWVLECTSVGKTKTLELE